MKPCTTVLILLLICCSNTIANAQKHREINKSEPVIITKVGDTLKTSTGVTVTTGQRVKVAKATGENGWYQTIGFKSATAWPVLFLHDTEIKNQYEGRSDPEQERENDKVKDYLHEGDSLLVTKIKRMGNKRKGYWYWILLRDTRFPGINYRCNFETAIRTGEIIFNINY